MASRGRVLRSFRDVEVWQKAMDLVVEVYRLSASFPSHERYGLTAQRRRAAVSIPSNIAEGRGRFGLRVFLYHLSVATGSIMEVETQLLIAERLTYLGDNDVRAFWVKLGEVQRLLAGMVRALRKKGTASVNQEPRAKSQ